MFETLAAGNTKFTNILNKSHIASSPILSDVLDKLMKMGVVEKRAPINDKNNKKRQDTIFVIILHCFTINIFINIFHN